MEAGKRAAERCIEIIEKRAPMTENELLLLNLVINDIRLEFGLEGAVPSASLVKDDTKPPEVWFW